MKARKGWAWLWLFLGVMYFVIPLAATFFFSLHGKRGVLSFAAYQRVFADPEFLHTFTFSLWMAAFTVVVGLALIIPTVIWIHLRCPWARNTMEGLSLLPFVIPPIVLVFGLIRLYGQPPIQLISSPALLVAGYVVLAFPYIYRSVDAGLRAMDLRGLTEAAQSLGAHWGTIMFRIVLPNMRVALLSATFLTFAIVIGELTMAVMLAWPAFGPYMAFVGRDLAYEPTALAILSFLMTWGLIGILQLVSGRFRGQGSSVGGAAH
jgi:putative spermidine/putrescine transport system permease protein